MKKLKILLTLLLVFTGAYSSDSFMGKIRDSVDAVFQKSVAGIGAACTWTKDEACPWIADKAWCDRSKLTRVAIGTGVLAASAGIAYKVSDSFSGGVDSLAGWTAGKAWCDRSKLARAAIGAGVTFPSATGIAYKTSDSFSRGVDSLVVSGYGKARAGVGSLCTWVKDEAYPWVAGKVWCDRSKFARVAIGAGVVSAGIAYKTSDRFSGGVDSLAGGARDIVTYKNAAGVAGLYIAIWVGGAIALERKQRALDGLGFLADGALRQGHPSGVRYVEKSKNVVAHSESGLILAHWAQGCGLNILSPAEICCNRGDFALFRASEVRRGDKSKKRAVITKLGEDLRANKLIKFEGDFSSLSEGYRWDLLRGMAAHEENVIKSQMTSLAKGMKWYNLFILRGRTDVDISLRKLLGADSDPENFSPKLVTSHSVDAIRAFGKKDPRDLALAFNHRKPITVGQNIVDNNLHVLSDIDVVEHVGECIVGGLGSPVRSGDIIAKQLPGSVWSGVYVKDGDIIKSETRVLRGGTPVTVGVVLANHVVMVRADIDACEAFRNLSLETKKWFTTGIVCPFQNPEDFWDLRVFGQNYERATKTYLMLFERLLYLKALAGCIDEEAKRVCERERIALSEEKHV